MSVTVPLSQPVKAHGDEITELVLKAPTTKEIIEIGLPTLMIPGADGESVGIEIRQKVVARYASRLAAVPMSTIESLALPDWSAVQGAVMGFFGQGSGEA